MYSTYTNTSTYTVVDIRRTFEGFSADFRMIAARTEKMSVQDVENTLHDIMAWAESKYLDYVDITLLDQNNKPARATRYTVDEKGKAIQSDRAGSNNWPNIANTHLTVIVKNNKAWDGLTQEQQSKFERDNGFKRNWGPSSIDNSYSHLSKSGAQLYGSNGYELRKDNFQ
ncbi:HORMA-1 domain-containing protein [Dawidia soli]|uniref:Bacterial HORMA domain-containing protein n=1 Tax=Dawidia soli TaxID=2782352 RepID=A0AAP2GFF2_9BACT|nr:hypothetical protein [Dawidia soli]MBT1689437.1 hypothetical protein [Dawidia soli]